MRNYSSFKASIAHCSSLLWSLSLYCCLLWFFVICSFFSICESFVDFHNDLFNLVRGLVTFRILAFDRRKRIVFIVQVTLWHFQHFYLSASLWHWLDRFLSLINFILQLLEYNSFVSSLHCVISNLQKFLWPTSIQSNIAIAQITIIDLILIKLCLFYLFLVSVQVLTAKLLLRRLNSCQHIQLFESKFLTWLYKLLELFSRNQAFYHLIENSHLLYYLNKIHFLLETLLCLKQFLVLLASSTASNFQKAWR